MEFNRLNTYKSTVYKSFLAVFIFTIGFANTVFAQERNGKLDQILRDLVTKEALFAEDASYVITSQHTSKKSGVVHIYYVQTIDGIPVLGTESSLHIGADSKIVKHNFGLVKNLSNEVINGRSASLSALAAIQSVAQKMSYQTLSTLNQIETKANAPQSYVFSNGGFSKRDIPVRLVYEYLPKEGVKLAWELSVEDFNNHEDWYTFKVDATSGDIISKYNLIAQCNLPHNHGDEGFIGPLEEPIKTDYDVLRTNNKTATTTTALAPNQYNVYAFPVESPNYGTRSVVTAPWTSGSGNASPFGWHDTNGVAGAEFTVTEGNNIDAFDFNTGDQPDGGATLDFNFPLNIAADPETYEDAAITNMFYWANIIHDITYEYGFDEASGNFQELNYTGAPGASDSVIGEGQKTGVCNAFFGTPTDGSNPTMQMFICDYALDRDGDLDNGVIAHEYGHGVSNRLVGGRLNTSCLNNSEQMGEGWSDYLGYWTTIEPGDAGDDARGIGTWLVNQGPTGGGIRQYPYTTSTSVNLHSYADAASVAVPHGVGSIWAEMLWEMTWALIDEYGYDQDLYNFTGTAADAGNIRSFALVIEGLKLTPCSPGMEDGRDAILAADQALYGGQHQCLIWTAFAKRGLGINASQGSSSRGDEVEDFTGPTPDFNASADSFCSTEGVQVLDGGFALNPGFYSGPGVTDNGDGTFNFDPAAAGLGVHIITFNTTGCDGTPAAPTDTIEVTDGDPEVVGNNVTLTLDGAGEATLENPDVVGNLTAGTGYTVVESGTFAPLDISSGATAVNLGDDAGTPAIPLGFTFTFFQVDYTNVYITSNGYLAFDATDLTDFSNDPMPSATLPDNIIAAVWDDYLPDGSETIRYKIEGTAPNRVFVVDYIAMPHWVSGGGGAPNTFQVQLFENGSKIEIHSTSITSDGGTRTQGIENVGATESYVVSGRNATSWTATNDYVAFIPNTGGLAENCGNAVTLSLSQSLFTCEDLGDNVVTITADDGAGGVTTVDVIVTIEGTGSVFSGGSWDVTPTAGSIASFQDSYDTLTDGGDVTACSCEIDALATVTINAGGTLNITGNINVDGTLDVLHEGSVYQFNDDAAVNNNGSIIVRKTSPTLNNRDFMIVGNPMTGSTRANTFGTAIQFREHITGNFIPNNDVATSDPGMENWADDNGDNWINYTGAINAGQGYLLMPQASTTVPDAATYFFNYTNGTLNNGVVEFDAEFNGTQNGSPNIVANPYPSAINANTFVGNNNSVVGTLYFWEHVNGPSASYDGYNPANYDMGDISMYLAGSGGTAAANGGTAPTGFIASGQGFGFKALSAGTVTFNNGQRVIGNNDDYRSAEAPKDRIWLNVRNASNQLGSQMLVAFVEGATQDFEPYYDAQRLATPVSLFSSLATGEQLTIQGREAFNIESQVVIGFRTQVTTNELYTISLDNVERALMSEDVNVYLEDTVTGIITNLSETNYSFNAAAGLNESRFNMFFQERVLGTEDNGLSTLSVVPNPTTGIVTVYAPQTVVDLIEVIDVRGRVILQKRFTAADGYQLDLTQAESAMYFVKIHTAEGIATKRLLKQ